MPRSLDRIALDSIASIFPTTRGVALARTALRECGWLESHRRHEPVDRNGAPIPWFTYAAIAFLDGRIAKDMRVFEFGAGNSTLWWAERVREVVSCEHDRAWLQRIAELAPPHVELLHRAVDDGYLNAARRLGPFEIIVVDGRRRVDSALASLAELSPDGVIVWDNSDRPSYRDGLEALSKLNFRHIDFYGLGPVNSRFWTTSIYYQTDNCLGI